MYEVISESKRIALCEEPRYIKVKPESGCYIQAESDEAEGIVINGLGVFSLKGKLKDLPEAEVRKIDGGALLLEIEKLNNSIAELENAIVELDAKQ